MKLVIGSVDVAGNLWSIRPDETPWTVDEGWQRAQSSVELRVSRRSGTVEAAIASSLAAGRAIVVFERASEFEPRIERLTERLVGLGVRPQWTWTSATTSAMRLDEERDALAWFVRHASELLFVDAVTYEKRRRLTPPSLPRVRPGLARSVPPDQVAISRSCA